jgi:hypothetical protein
VLNQGSGSAERLFFAPHLGGHHALGVAFSFSSEGTDAVDHRSADVGFWANLAPHASRLDHFSTRAVRSCKFLSVALQQHGGAVSVDRDAQGL